MATTRIMPLHIDKGHTKSQAVSDLIDYVSNPQKTDNSRLVTGFACDRRMADAEFLLAKREYISVTGEITLKEAMLCHILEDRNLKRDIDYSIHCFFSPVPLLAQMEKQPSTFHLLLLDIKLENDNGLSLAAHLREIDADCFIIYITAYRDYVFDCFDTRPLHYLLKQFMNFTDLCTPLRSQSVSSSRKVH